MTSKLTGDKANQESPTQKPLEIIEQEIKPLECFLRLAQLAAKETLSADEHFDYVSMLTFAHSMAEEYLEPAKLREVRQHPVPAPKGTWRHASGRPLTEAEQKMADAIWFDPAQDGYEPIKHPEPAPPSANIPSAYIAICEGCGCARMDHSAYGNCPPYTDPNKLYRVKGEHPEPTKVKSPICENCGHAQELHDGGKYCCLRPSDSIPKWMCNCTTFVGSEVEPRTPVTPQYHRDCPRCGANHVERPQDCPNVAEVKPRTGDKS